MGATNSTPGYLTEGERQEVLDAVRNQELPAEVRGVLDDCATGPGDRDRFLWKWTQSVFPHIQLSSVDTRPDDVVATKTIVTMLVSLYDDLIEKHGDRATFDRAALVPFHDNVAVEAPGVDREYIETIERVWTEVDARIRDAPNHDQYRQCFEYDFKQILNAVEYTALLNDTPEVANLKELHVHESYNMSMFVYADIDLMYSTGFDRADLGSLRNAVWHGQQMARIGNWLTTWERELREADYSSGVVVRALENGAVRPETLQSMGDDPAGASPSEVAARIRETGSERHLLERWMRERGRLREFDELIDSVDIDQYASGLETVLKYHLATRGLK
ncbi:hypothetical protein [Halobellus ruber]|uniref:Uncharacterized protein n=1 Tax=Halobellus ruber TaxID=2761102 RepID=A0A7J9SKQ9_9EURY|nr:hypothetical protein [Halobellus ruber]MBB6646699.1 hypothetical protein [Halobellus ruber]